LCVFCLGSFQPTVTKVFHRRSCTSGRTYKYPEPLGAISHLCGLEVYISQPRSCRFSGIMPVTCAPSKADRMPFERASEAISFAGRTTPVSVVMWLTEMMRVRGVIAALIGFRMSAALRGGLGIWNFLTTTP